MTSETHVITPQRVGAEPTATGPRGERSVLPKRRKLSLTNLVIDVVLLLFGCFMILPLMLLVANAFKTPTEMLVWPPTLVPHDPTIANFTAVLSSTPLLRWIFNSLSFALLSALSISITSSIAGYLMAKFPSWTMSVLFAVILATAIVPFEVYMIPLYFQAQGLGLLNSLGGLLLGYLVMSFGIFLIRQNVIHSIPDELLEAARIDGAGEIWIFLRIVLPLLRGALGALFVLAFLPGVDCVCLADHRRHHQARATPSRWGWRCSRPASPSTSAGSAPPRPLVLVPSGHHLHLPAPEFRPGCGQHGAQGMTAFLKAVTGLYMAANAATLRWMLARPRFHGVYLNTKLNPLTLEDYDAADGWRGPDWTYGWIQGRGLESLATHAAAFVDTDPDLTEALDDAGRALYGALDALQARDGHGYFRYGPDMQPVSGADEGPLAPQICGGDVYTYSDAFFAKGLICGAARYAPADLPRHLDALERVIDAIGEERFQMAEKVPLTPAAAAAEPADFGPRMILLGAAGTLRRLGQAGATAYADGFIAHILSHHLDQGSGLLRNTPGQDDCNVGHAIEFVGFALDHLGKDGDRQTLNTLERILFASFDHGFAPPGIRLTVSARTGDPVSPFCPWWSLPETIRAAALAFEATGSADAFRIWRAADARFWAAYWRGTPPVAYQCLTPEGPVDYVPATPCLDPGYHTGLSLLAAARVAERLCPVPTH